MKKSILLLFATIATSFYAESANLEGLNLDGLNSGETKLSSEGESRTLEISSNAPWHLTTDCDWVTFSTEKGRATKGENTYKVTLSAEFNFYEERAAQVTLTAEDPYRTIDFTLTQPKFIRPVTKYQVGDPDVTFDESCFDSTYIFNEKMEVWRKAGVEGGVPYLADQLKRVTKKFKRGTSFSTIKEYLEANKDREIIVLLQNGKYTLDVPIHIYSNTTIIGESRDGVQISVDTEIKASAYISMAGSTNAGLRNVSINGLWLNEDGENRPKYDWKTEIPDRAKNRTIDMGPCRNCFLDNVKLTNNPSHPIWMTGDNNTVRNVEIEGAFNKGGGCQGYLFIASNNSLITNCRVTRIRHISFQGEKSRWNVFYDNDLDQEVSFHVGDGGNNLIERNRIHLPKYMPCGFNAIMGPWSGQHRVGGLNFIYMNKCKEDNPGRKGKTPWSDDVLYIGPHVVSVGGDNPTRYTNFHPSEGQEPKGGTLYPVKLN